MSQGRVFYTSDLHIGHNRVAGIRGFWNEKDAKWDEETQAYLCDPDTALHDTTLAEEWDSTVTHLDTVWVLGDISINGGQHALDWIAERPGVKHLVAGNHDPVHSLIDRRAPQKMAHWMMYFNSIQPYARRRLEGINFMLCHFPYWPLDREGEEPRYEQARLPDLGLPLVHGHTHSTKVLEFPNHYHVGWDAHRSLVPQEKIHEWLKTL